MASARGGRGRPGRGPTLFTVGTGGHSFFRVRRADDRLAVEPILRAGALQLELEPLEASFRFLGAGGVQLDAGTIDCDG